MNDGADKIKRDECWFAANVIPQSMISSIAIMVPNREEEDTSCTIDVARKKKQTSHPRKSFMADLSEGITTLQAPCCRYIVSAQTILEDQFRSPRTDSVINDRQGMSLFRDDPFQARRFLIVILICSRTSASIHSTHSHSSKSPLAAPCIYRRQTSDPGRKSKLHRATSSPDRLSGANTMSPGMPVSSFSIHNRTPRLEQLHSVNPSIVHCITKHQNLFPCSRFLALPR